MSSHHRRLTFSQRLAQDRKIELSDFESYVLRHGLHFPLRWFYPLLKPFLGHYLQADIQCVRTAGKLRFNRELEREMTEFSYHPRNHSFLRRTLRQRLSTHRVYRLLRSLPRGDRD